MVNGKTLPQALTEKNIEDIIERKLNAFFKKVNAKIDTFLPIVNELKSSVNEIQSTTNKLQEDCNRITQAISFLSEQYEDVSNRVTLAEVAT